MVMPFNLGRRIAQMRNPDTNGNITAAFVDDSSDQRQVSRDVIADIVSELHDRMFSDSHTRYHWKGLTADDKARECEQFAPLAWGGGIDQNFMRLGIGKAEWEHFVTITSGTLDQASLTDDEKEYLFSLVTGARAKLAVGVQPPPRVNVFDVFTHQLTEREREVLHHLAMGKNNPEIARELFISINTVTRHITNIFTKTSTTNRVQAAVYAAPRHLV